LEQGISLQHAEIGDIIDTVLHVSVPEAIIFPVFSQHIRESEKERGSLQTAPTTI
jgi:hypothetical protein